jgi:hypothetical protein
VRTDRTRAGGVRSDGRRVTTRSPLGTVGALAALLAILVLLAACSLPGDPSAGTAGETPTDAPSTPQDEDVDPRDDDGDPRDEDANPQDEDVDPRDDDGDPREEDANPREEDANPRDEDLDLGDEGDASEDAPDGALPACPDDVLAGVEQTIGAQLDAFADDDVALALSYASEAFRSQLDTDSFERLIEGSFPAVADPARFSIEGCRSEQTSAQVLVGVVGTDGGRMSLLYVMVEEEGRWAIDGARGVTSDPGTVA